MEANDDQRGERKPPRPTGSNLTQHAWDELDRAGLFTPEGDLYGGMAGRAVLELIECFNGQGHSGTSAGIVVDVFQRLARFEPLSPLTDDPAEWMEVTDGFWQSTRQADAFSRDGGRTYTRNSTGPDLTFTSRDAALPDEVPDPTPTLTIKRLCGGCGHTLRPFHDQDDEPVYGCVLCRLRYSSGAEGTPASSGADQDEERS